MNYTTLIMSTVTFGSIMLIMGMDESAILIMSGLFLLLGVIFVDNKPESNSNNTSHRFEHDSDMTATERNETWFYEDLSKEELNKELKWTQKDDDMLQ